MSQRGAELQPPFSCRDTGQQKSPCESAGQYPPAKALHAARQPQRGQEHPAQQNKAVIYQGHQGGHRELPPDIQQRGKTGSRQKKYLGRQDNTQKMRQPCMLFHREARRDKPRQRSGKQPAQHGKAKDGQCRPGEHRTEKTPAVLFVLLEQRAQKRNQRDGNITARQQIIDEIRHDKCREVNIGFARGAELPGDHLVPRQPHEAGEQHAEAHDQRGGSHFLPGAQYRHVPAPFPYASPYAPSSAPARSISRTDSGGTTTYSVTR